MNSFVYHSPIRSIVRKLKFAFQYIVGMSVNDIAGCAMKQNCDGILILVVVPFAIQSFCKMHRLIWYYEARHNDAENFHNPPNEDMQTRPIYIYIYNIIFSQKQEFIPRRKISSASFRNPLSFHYWRSRYKIANSDCCA